MTASEPKKLKNKLEERFPKANVNLLDTSNEPYSLEWENKFRSDILRVIPTNTTIQVEINKDKKVMTRDDLIKYVINLKKQS
jgi:hypothetical protein